MIILKIGQNTLIYLLTGLAKIQCIDNEAWLCTYLPTLLAGSS